MLLLISDSLVLRPCTTKHRFWEILEWFLRLNEHYHYFTITTSLLHSTGLYTLLHRLPKVPQIKLLVEESFQLIIFSLLPLSSSSIFNFVFYLGNIDLWHYMFHVYSVLFLLLNSRTCSHQIFSFYKSSYNWPISSCIPPL